MAVLGVMTYITSFLGNLMNPVIGLRHLEGVQIESNMIEVVTKVLVTDDVRDHLSYVVCDKAWNKYTLHWSMEELQVINNNEYNSNHNRIWCVGHDINLAAR